MVQRYGSYQNLLLTTYELEGSEVLAWESYIRFFGAMALRSQNLHVSIYLFFALKFLGFYLHTNYRLTGTARNGPGGDIASRM